MIFHRSDGKSPQAFGTLLCILVKLAVWMVSILPLISNCYVIKEWFFYINHFPLIIFYHSVWLCFEPFGSQSRCIVNWCSLRLRAKDMTIMICYNRLLDRKRGLSVDDIMPRRDGPENLRILKRSQLDFDHWKM